MKHMEIVYIILLNGKGIVYIYTEPDWHYSSWDAMSLKTV